MTLKAVIVPKLMYLGSQWCSKFDAVTASIEV